VRPVSKINLIMTSKINSRRHQKSKLKKQPITLRKQPFLIKKQPTALKKQSVTFKKEIIGVLLRVIRYIVWLKEFKFQLYKSPWPKMFKFQEYDRIITG